MTARDRMYSVSCPVCGRLVCRSSTGSEIEIKCPKCKTMLYFQHYKNGQLIFRDVRTRYSAG